MPPSNYPSRPNRWPLIIILIVLAGGGIAAWLVLRPRHHRDALPKEPTATEREVADATPTPPESHFRSARVLTTRPITYPEQAFLNRVEGVVRVKFSIDDSGHVTNVVVTKSSGSVMLDAMALEYELKQWTFEPATLDGKPVPGTLEKEFEFKLDPAAQRALAEKRLAAKVGTPDAPYPKAAIPLKAKGSCTITVHWTKAGLVDTIVLTKASGSNILDRAALRFAYENWRVDPNDAGKEFSKTMEFTPPLATDDTPSPLPSAAGGSPIATP